MSLTVENRIEISPVIRPSTSMTDLLTPHGSFQIYSRLNNNFFDDYFVYFIVEGENFEFKLWTDEFRIHVLRNGQRCSLTREIQNNQILSYFKLAWTPYAIGFVTPDSEGQIKIGLRTLPISVPLSLKHWAKDQGLKPQKFYDSEADFRDTVYQCISTLKIKIEGNESADSFWDFTYDRNKILDKKPKREPKVHPLIKTIIETELYLKGIIVFRENTTAEGNIDLTLVANIKDSSPANVCIEVENLHSNEIESGLTKQLPNYMRS